MARSRILKPGFFLNEHLAALPYEVRLCFAGLWLLADREGRLPDRPKRIKAETFPYDSVDIDVVLATLAESGFIVRYTVNMERYIEIPKFIEHQRPHMREAKSTIPAPPKAQPRHHLGTAKAPPRCSVSCSDSDSDSDSDSVKNKYKSSAPHIPARREHPPNGNGHSERLPRQNLKVITKIAHEVIRAKPHGAFADLKDAAKEQCARAHIRYDADVIGAALESAMAQRRLQ